jgi:RimJ/RimL family protein N-acetyltransferase
MTLDPARVTLTDLTPSHATAMHRWMCDPVVSTNVGLRSEPSLEKTLAWLERAASDDTTAARAIVLDGVHVGNVVLDQIDRYVSKGRLSIYVGEPAARGQGVGRLALSLVLDLAFGPLGLHKVWLTVHAQNLGAIAAYTAVGFAIEGTHRDEFLLDGARLDEIYMGILRSDRRP